MNYNCKEVVCLSDCCYGLKQYEVYKVEHYYTNGLIKLECNHINYSEKNFMTIDEYRLLKLNKIKEKINKK